MTDPNDTDNPRTTAPAHDPRSATPSDVVTDAALEALGALPPADARAFQSRLDRGHPVASAEFHAFRLVVDQLLESAPAVPPPPALRARLMDRIAGVTPGPTGGDAAVGTHEAEHAEEIQVWRRWTESPRSGLYTLPAGTDGWQKTAIEGIEVRNLFADREQKRVTMMIRMAPGTAYPTHRHAGVEECYVLEGDLRVPADPEVHLHRGDYQRADAASIHGVQSTDTGCLLLLVSSTDDELIEG